MIPNQEASYSSPIAATIQGSRRALFFTRAGLVIVDPASVPFLGGSEVDFVDDLFGASFRVVNPDDTASCGCGTSFSI